MNPLMREAVLSILVRGLGFAGAGLVSKGILTEAEVTTYAAGLAAMLVSLGYGLWRTYASRVKLVTAMASESPLNEADVKAQVKAGLAPSATTPCSEIPHR